MQPTGSCPRCGIGILSPQMVEELLTVGTDAVQVTVEADVCSSCGERWFAPAATALIDHALTQLRTGDHGHLTPIGSIYKAS